MPTNWTGLRIGLDLDNTLINYDRLFYEVAVSRNLIPADFAGAKRDIRDQIRLLPEIDGEIEWQHVQAEVYGPAIEGAVAAEGALDFLLTARAGGAELTIVSHKTALANMGDRTVNLRDAARAWLLANGMLGPQAVPEESLYFESTRAEKIARIVALHCTHFVDDLEEVFDDPAFPPDVQRFLFVTGTAPQSHYRTFASFFEIANAFAAR